MAVAVISGAKSDGDAVSVEVSPEQTRAARALLGLSQQGLASLAGVQRRVVIDFENGVSLPHRRTALALRRVLENAGVRFLTGSDGGLGVRLTREGLDRLRDSVRRTDRPAG